MPVAAGDRHFCACNSRPKQAQKALYCGMSLPLCGRNHTLQCASRPPIPYNTRLTAPALNGLAWEWPCNRWQRATWARSAMACVREHHWHKE